MFLNDNSDHYDQQHQAGGRIFEYLSRPEVFIGSVCRGMGSDPVATKHSDMQREDPN